MDQSERRARVRQTFDTVADVYDGPSLSWFDQTADKLAELSELKSGQSALDLASGTGKVAIRLAQLAPSAQVIGVDLSPGMLGQAQKKATAAGLQNITFEVGAFDELERPGQFDVVTCSFGLFFVEDMVSSLRTFASQAKSGGTVLISSFAEGLFSPFTEAFSRLYAEFGFEVSPPSWLRVNTEDKLRSVFEEAGLTHVSLTRHDFGRPLTSTAHWWEIIESAGYRGMLLAMTDEQRARFKEEHLAEVQSLMDAGKDRLNVTVLVGKAAVTS